MPRVPLSAFSETVCALLDIRDGRTVHAQAVCDDCKTHPVKDCTSRSLTRSCQTCSCGHPWYFHKLAGHKVCVKEGCTCQKFAEKP